MAGACEEYGVKTGQGQVKVRSSSMARKQEDWGAGYTLRGVFYPLTR